jgi:hypothetical protein
MGELMRFTLANPTSACPICHFAANVVTDLYVGRAVNCSRCGDFSLPQDVGEDLNFLLKNDKARVLASNNIRKTDIDGNRFRLSYEFFESLKSQSLPTPIEVADNLIRWIAQKTDSRFGHLVEVVYNSGDVLGYVGAIGPDEVHWCIVNHREDGFILQTKINPGVIPTRVEVWLTSKGWNRFDALSRARISSKFAFFARQFNNVDLDFVFEKCLQPAVKATGYDLRTVTQQAGLIDAVIEDEIRRCRFLLADLSDGNSGSYWEAGFAAGLGKPVIYLCKDGVETHFDANHHQTVRWTRENLTEASMKLKAIIRNTLLGDAVQAD